jgi:two-component system, NtrC family, response regulator AtoC
VPRGHLLLVDSDASVAGCLTEMLVGEDVQIKHTASSSAAAELAGEQPYDAMFVDLRLAGGIELVKEWVTCWAPTPIVALANDATSAEIVDVMRSGADFVGKPLCADEVLHVVRKALASAARRADEPQPSALRVTGLVGASDAMARVQDLIHRAAAGSATVLIRGESGTGKELVARAIHQQSARAAGPFVKIDCTSLPDALLESELFGHEKGAFTGAVARKPGRIELAQGGTLFLDEIGDVSSSMQAKLLRLLQDREFERLGGMQTLKIDVRFLAATHRNLEAMVKQQKLRQDLFYRLNVVPLWLPPLRVRREDIAALARHFCGRLGAANGKPDACLDAGALDALCSYAWPGNVRQLENFVERMIVLTDGPAISRADVARELAEQIEFSAAVTLTSTAERQPSSVGVAGLDAAVRRTERRAIEKALARSGGNRTVAARVLGISRATFYCKLKEYELS